MLNKKMIDVNGVTIAVMQSDSLIINDVQSALDLIGTLGFDDNCHRIAIYKEAIIDDFFKLSTGLAGEILQKFVNYRKKLAIIGDFSCYSSKPLKDFIYECNRGNSIFFVADEQQAVERLAK